MKLKLFITIALLGFYLNQFGQQNSAWDKWNLLTGEWVGEVNGRPGPGSRNFSFTFDLDNKILIRKGRVEYPAANNQPKFIGDDLMIIYQDYTQKPSKAIYFDNTGHIINYSITYAEKSIVLLSEKIPMVPAYRLTYDFLPNETVNIKFEISQDGVKFSTYVEGKSKKVK